MSNAAAPAHTLELPQVLDLTAAGPLTEQLLADRGLDLSLDASRLQVLLSCVATWKADGAKLRLVNESPEFVEALEQFGIPPATLATGKPS